MRTPDPIGDADRHFAALEDARDEQERAWRHRDMGDLTVTVDGIDVDLTDVRRPTRATLTDPGDPWEWATATPDTVDAADIVAALEDEHG